MLNTDQRPVFSIATVSLTVGILIGAIGMALLRPPAKAIATNEPLAEQPAKAAPSVPI